MWRRHVVPSTALWVVWVLVLATGCCHGAKPFTQWTEHLYGKVAGDGVEYSSFQVEKGVTEVQVTFSRSDLRGRTVAPMLYGKLGAIPTLTSYDWNFNGTVDSFWLTESIPNLKAGTYYIALWGGDLPGTINNFGIGNSTNVWYYLDITSFGCMDPDKTGYNCNFQVASTSKQLVFTPQLQTVTNSTAKKGPAMTGCMDYLSNLQFFTIELTSPQLRLVTTLTIPQTFTRNDVYYWALYDNPANPLDPTAIPLADGAGYLTDGSATLQYDVPTIGTYWVLMYMDAPPKSSRCVSSTGVAFSLAWFAESCSPTPTIDMCRTSWLRLNEMRSDPSRNQSVLDAWFLADSPVTTRAGAFDAATGYTVNIRDNYAGSNLIMHLVAPSPFIDLSNVTIFIRVDGLPTESTHDYKLVGSDATALPEKSSKTFLLYNENALRQRLQTKSLYTVAWPMLRFPRVGKWNIVIKTSQPQPWTHMLVLQSSPCPVDMCGEYGACKVSTTYQGLVIGKCQCIYGYAGDYCDHLYLDNYESRSYFLILSNFAILPAAIVSFQRSLYVEAFLFMSLGVISSVYHACDINWVCVVQYSYLQKLDFIFSFNSILLCLFHLAGVRPKRKAIMQFIGLTLLVILIAIDPTTMTNWLIIGGLGGGQLVIAWTTYIVLARVVMGRSTKVRRILYSFLFLSGNFHVPLLVLGGLLWAAGLICWFLNRGPSYWLEHSLWHIFAMSAAGALMACRTGQWYKILDDNGIDALPRVHSPISKRPFFGTNDELKTTAQCMVAVTVTPACATPTQSRNLSLDLGELQQEESR